MKILAIDHGTKKLGVAVSDELEISAKPLSVLKINNETHALELLRKLCHQEQVEKILLGLPTGLFNHDSAQTKLVRDFAEKLSQITGIEVMFWDETYSSKAARKTTKKNLDSEAAALLLQEYLNSDTKRQI